MKLSEYLKTLEVMTPAQIAETFRAQGIRGQRESFYNCPVVKAIYRNCPDYWTGLKIKNGQQNEKTGDWSYWATLGDPQIMDPHLPPSVMNFIGLFDSGYFPELSV